MTTHDVLLAPAVRGDHEGGPPVAGDGAAAAHVVRVPAGELTVAARDAVTLASEADSLVLTAATEIVLSVGQSTLTLRADGTILLNGRRMTLNAPAMIELNPATPPAGPAPDAVDPTPVDPTPVDPTPVDPTPVDPTPVDPTPVDPDTGGGPPCGCRGARREVQP